MANPWFAFYLDDYERKTSHLSMLEHGAYGTAIRRYYMVGGPLPANAEQLHRVCRAIAPEEKAALDSVMAQYFHLEADGWHHDRCDEEIAKSREISEKRANSASIRHSKSNANAPANAKQMQTQLQPQPHIELVLSKPAFSLPVWIPEKAWVAYEEMRKAIKKPLANTKARELAVAKLQKLMDSGHNPEAVLYQSIFNSWQGLFPIREDGNGANQPNKPARVSAAEAREQSNTDAIENVLRKRHGDSALGAAGGETKQGNTDRGGLQPVACGPVVLPPISH
jgi:uncharacterized protein YdaU (DUF1376 family)